MFGGFSGIWQWLIVLAIVLLLFGGRGKISALMGDLGKGLRSFKKNVKDEGKGDADESMEEPAKRIEDGSDDAASKKSDSDKKTAANS